MWWSYLMLVIGFAIGFFTCAIFTVAREADDDMDRFMSERKEVSRRNTKS